MPLSEDEIQKIHAYWSAANYLSVGQIYLLDNPFLREPLRLEHIKPRLLGHWGTTPGLNFLYVHLNRVIMARDLNVIYIAGPGHGGPGLVANTYLEGSYSEFYPNVPQNAEGMKKLLRQFSFPGGVGSHATPELPGSIHEGGELGYSLFHAYGAAFDNPDLLVACVIGDGEAETGPLAAAWHSNKFLNPARDGAVLPILHFNGYKIANPTVLARIPREELESLLVGYGHNPHFVVGSDPIAMHQRMAATLDAVLDEIRSIQDRARDGGDLSRPRWPMIVLVTPKGWTGPVEVDGRKVEGTWRSHQVPFADLATNPSQLGELERWLKSYGPAKLFDEEGRFWPDLAGLAPKGERRMGANPHANGGTLLRDLALPDFREYAVDVPKPAVEFAEAARALGRYLRDVMKVNEKARNFRVFGPDETASNRLDALFEVTGRGWMGTRLPADYDRRVAQRVDQGEETQQSETAPTADRGTGRVTPPRARGRPGLRGPSRRWRAWDGTHPLHRRRRQRGDQARLHDVERAIRQIPLDVLRSAQPCLTEVQQARVLLSLHQRTNRFIALVNPSSWRNVVKDRLEAAGRSPRAFAEPWKLAKR